MRKICFMLLLPLVYACSHQIEGNFVSLTGNIKGLGNDTLYIYGTDRFYNRTDTLIVQKDRFEAMLPVDTLVAVQLQFPNGSQYPLFIDKKKHIDIKGSTDNLEHLNVTGSIPNEELTSFHQEVQELAQPTDELLKEKAHAFISSHPTSLASIYVLKKYFVQSNEPDYSLIRKLIENMSGELKDRPDISTLQEKLISEGKSDVGKTVIYFTVTNPKGEKISRSSFRGKYLLLNFWASWDEQSREANKTLRRIYRKEKDNDDLVLLGISLDVDRADWLNAIEKDSLEWEQGCDFGGWNSDVIEKLGVQAIPTNLLIAPSGRIEARDVDEQTFFQKWEMLQQRKKKK